MTKVTSDGSTASYYELPEGAQELQHLISYRNMNGQLAEIFRACYRYGIASHSDQLRDAKKMVFYAMAEVERLEKWALLADLASSTGAELVGYDREADAFLRAQPFTLNTEALHAEPSIEDMTDPHNWRAGDWVEVTGDDSGHDFKIGELVRMCSIETIDSFTAKGSTGERWLGHEEVRFHARPDAEGWIKWEGGECPVGGDVGVDILTAAGDVESQKAGDFVWDHYDEPYDIIAYRPHLATKQGKG